MALDLVYTDSGHSDIGFVGAFSLDMAFGSSENSFEMTVPLSMDIADGAYVYAPGTEFGGIVRGGSLSTLDDPHVRTVSGRTWHGMLADRVIRPQAGQGYFSVSGDANDCIRATVENIGLAGVFSVAGPMGVSISHRHERYVDGYYGICSMLGANGLKLRIEKGAAAKPVLSAVPLGVYVDDGATGECRFKIMWDHPVNHLICLGKGELAARTVIDLYADADGNVSRTQSIFGINEVVRTYDASSVEDDQLEEDGAKKLRELQAGGGAAIKTPQGMTFDVGDVVGVADYDLGITLAATVEKTILKVNEFGFVDISNEIGEVKGL